MRKLIAIFILLSFLSGCGRDVTTFDEVIENGKVEIDGIIYNVDSNGEIFYEYDTNGNLIKSTTIKGDRKNESNFVYDNDLLIEEHKSLETIDRIMFFTYDSNDRVIRTVNQYEDYDFVTECEYDENRFKQIDKNYDGQIIEYREGILDKNDNLLRYTVYDSEHNPTDYVVNDYSKDKLITSVSKGLDDRAEFKYYQYNNRGDIIFIYTIYHDNEYIMRVNFFEYEYNKEELPTYKKQYYVQAVIDKDNIRDYWDQIF